MSLDSSNKVVLNNHTNFNPEDSCKTSVSQGSQPSESSPLRRSHDVKFVDKTKSLDLPEALVKTQSVAATAIVDTTSPTLPKKMNNVIHAIVQFFMSVHYEQPLFFPFSSKIAAEQAEKKAPDREEILRLRTARKEEKRKEQERKRPDAENAVNGILRNSRKGLPKKDESGMPEKKARIEHKAAKITEDDAHNNMIQITEIESDILDGAATIVAVQTQHFKEILFQRESRLTNGLSASKKQIIDLRVSDVQPSDTELNASQKKTIDLSGTLKHDEISDWKDSIAFLKNSFFKGEASGKTSATKDSSNQEHKELMNKKNAALFHEWDKKWQELCQAEKNQTDFEGCSQQVIKALVKFAQERRTEFLKLVLVTKQRAADPLNILKHGLQCITYAKNNILKQDYPTKFTCAGNKNVRELKTDLKKLKNRGAEIQPKWKVQVKEIKKNIKEEISKKVRREIEAKSQDVGANAYPLKLALKRFESALNTSQGNPANYESQYGIIDEIDECLEIYVTRGGILSQDVFMQDKVQEFEDIGLKNFTEARRNLKIENRQMEEKEGKPLTPAVPNVKELHRFLKAVCSFLKKKVNTASVQVANADAHEMEIDRLTQSVSDFLLKTIKMHKILSHNRFIDLFSSHSAFLSRLCYALDKIQDPDKRIQVQNFVEQELSPKLTLKETNLHRNTQAQHLCRKDKRRAHRPIEAQMDIVADITMVDFPKKENGLNFLNFKKAKQELKNDRYDFQCAHVVPFPSLFARRHRVSEQKRSELQQSATSITYVKATKKQRETLFRDDIDKIHEAFKDDAREFMNHALELIMKISLEEVSHTVHLPGVFNQIVDGASEKYVDFGNQEHNEYQRLFQENQIANEQKIAAFKNRPADAFKAYCSEIVDSCLTNVRNFFVVDSTQTTEETKVLAASNSSNSSSLASADANLFSSASATPTLTTQPQPHSFHSTQIRESTPVYNSNSSLSFTSADLSSGASVMPTLTTQPQSLSFYSTQMRESTALYNEHSSSSFASSNVSSSASVTSELTTQTHALVVTQTLCNSSNTSSSNVFTNAIDTVITFFAPEPKDKLPTAELYSKKCYKYLLGLDFFSMVQGKRKFLESEVMQNEKNYIAGVKRALARKINELVNLPGNKTLTNLILAVSFCNVFYGLKNSEALYGAKLPEEEDQAVIEAMLKLQQWIDS